jgi:hypothetical protein
MNKGHKQTQPGGAKGKGAPAKKPATTTTHKPAQSTANAGADKKAAAKTHKPEAGKKQVSKLKILKQKKQLLLQKLKRQPLKR